VIFHLCQFLTRLLYLAKQRLRDLVKPDNYALATNVMADLSFSIQENFANVWDIKCWLWTDIIHATPDLVDGTVIIVDADDLPPKSSLSLPGQT